jgi:hypothetical protein
MRLEMVNEEKVGIWEVEKILDRRRNFKLGRRREYKVK